MMTQGDTKIAHAATAGDGGERTWHRDGALLYTLKPHVNQFGRSRGKMVNDVTVRVEGPDADTIATEIHAALAQTPAAQAPAGEDIRSFARAILHGDDDHREWLAEAAEAFIGGLKMPPPRGKGTPTDAQPKAARPVGDEALRAALGAPHCYVAPGRDTANDYGAIDANCCEEGELNRPLWTFEDIVRALASHPTTGQETVATPRDGGVREKAAENEDAYIARVLAMSSDEIRAEAEAVGIELPEPRSLPTSLRNLRFRLESALANRLEEGDREAIAWLNDGVISIGAALAALSAPGSAGPGEQRPAAAPAQIEVSANDELWDAIHEAMVCAWNLLDGTADDASGACQEDWDALAMAMETMRNLVPETEEPFSPSYAVPYLRAALATPSPAQEPGTGDTGAKERARKRIQALGAAMSRRDWSAAESAYEAIRDAHDRPDIYDAPLLATPATTADTRGPAEGAR